MDMPRPGPEHERLTRLAGEWQGEERIHPSQFDPEGGTATGRQRARMDLDGFYLIGDYEQAREGRVNFRGHAVYGWDPRGTCYTMHWFDSTGIEHGTPGIGTWDGDTVVFEHDLRPFGLTRYTYTVGEGEYRLLIENSADGSAWTPFLDGAYRRISG